ncbi:hypothetical protein ACNKHT_12645 [Shigella flexneri]
MRNGMREALVAPLDFTSLRDAVTDFEQHRDGTPGKSNSTDNAPASQWRIGCISREGNLLSRKMKASTMNYHCTGSWLLADSRTTPRRSLNRRCMSRVPDFSFQHSPTLFTRNVPTRYYGYVTQPWFIGHSQRENRHHAVRWFTSRETGTRQQY